MNTLEGQRFPTIASIAHEPEAPPRTPTQNPVGVELALAGVGLAGVYGLAVGARVGGLSLVRHAIGAPLGLVGTIALSVPALLVLFALLDAPVSPRPLAEASARTLGSVGLLLAGMAPATALLLVTIESPDAARVVVGGGLTIAGLVGGLPLVRALMRALSEAPTSVWWRGYLLLTGFIVFSCMLAARLWEALLPVLGGVS